MWACGPTTGTVVCHRMSSIFRHSPDLLLFEALALRIPMSLALSFLVRSSPSHPACCRVSSKVWSIGRGFHVAAPKAKSTPGALLASRDSVLADQLRAPGAPSTGNDAAHVPVLLKEVVAQFENRRLKCFVDCTLGAGGHASAIISTHPEMQIFLGMDVDPVAHAEAYPKLQGAALSGTNSDLNIHVKCTNFTNIKSAIRDVDPMLTTGGVDGILMDLGMSSMQVNEADRGFSFMRDGPADMRMDPTSTFNAPSIGLLSPMLLHEMWEHLKGNYDRIDTIHDYGYHNSGLFLGAVHATLNAEVILNTWPEVEVGRILRDYGEERRWKYLARKIVQERLTGGISTTSQLVEIIGGSSFIRTKGKHKRLKPAAHPATRTFQALRIAVNDELKSLELALCDAFSCLSPGGRLQVISFHSLEDRIIKQFFLTAAGLHKNPLDQEEDEGGRSTPQEYTHVPGETRHSKYVRKKSHHKESGESPSRNRNVVEGSSAIILTKRPIVPSDEEINRNPRSRSAKLRVLEKK